MSFLAPEERKKTEILQIRCDPSLIRLFKLFTVENGFKSYADALEYLLLSAGYRRERALRLKLVDQSGVEAVEHRSEQKTGLPTHVKLKVVDEVEKPTRT